MVFLWTMLQRLENGIFFDNHEIYFFNRCDSIFEEKLESRFPSTLVREICADVCVIKISVAPSPAGKMCVYLCNYVKSRKIRVKYINSRDFFLTEIFFSNLKQFVRTCSPIVKTYFETILLLHKKFFKDRILIAKTFEFSIKFFDFLIFFIQISERHCRFWIKNSSNQKVLHSQDEQWALLAQEKWKIQTFSSNSIKFIQQGICFSYGITISEHPQQRDMCWCVFNKDFCNTLNKSDVCVDV